MNTRPIPILLALAAAGMTAIISIVQKVSFGVFLLRLFVVVLIFYALGIFVGILFLEALGPEKKPGDEKKDHIDEDGSGEGISDGEAAGERPEELEDVTEDVSGGADEDDEPFADDE
ncbi:MAG: hypothetical protein IJT32_03890 [Lachnospiraceae bacterium]|nr:hypothetical protein [Lachnospiraceae bacterium]